MPPKKKDEEVDLSTLPPWLPLKFMVLFNCPKAKAELLKNYMRDKPKEYQKNITRADIVNYGKEKGLYFDPNQVPEKGKKEAKAAADVPTELTPDLLAKIYITMMADLDIQGRKVRSLPKNPCMSCMIPLGQKRKIRPRAGNER